MAKENVIVFDGEDKFIKPKKSVYNKAKGIAKNVSATGEVISTSTTTNETIKTLPIATGAQSSSQTSENVTPPTSGGGSTSATNVLPFDDKLTGRGLLSDAKGDKKVIPIGDAINQSPNYGSNPDAGQTDATPQPFCPSGTHYDVTYGRCVEDTPPPIEKVCPDGYLKDVDGNCVENPKNPPSGGTTSGGVVLPINFGQPVGGGTSGGGGGGGSEDSAQAPAKKNYFWLYVIGAGILYMALKKKSN